MTLTKDMGVLRTIPLFAKVDPAKLKLLAFTSERLAYVSGDERFHQGDHGDAAYIILKGGADGIPLAWS
jgi:CRP/FNR family transcriptional regulator, cyclic AMP receptor protein